MAPHSRVSTSPSFEASPALQRPEVSASVDAFRRILRALRLAARQTQVTAGISAAQLHVLQALGDGTDASLSQIAARTMTDRTSVAAAVEPLVSAGLATRAPSAVDRRRAAIRITARGRGVLRRAPTTPIALLVSGLSALDKRTLSSLAGALSTLTTEMGLRDQRAGMLFDDGEEGARAAVAHARKSRR